jgi:hypothetical protein
LSAELFCAFAMLPHFASIERIADSITWPRITAQSLRDSRGITTAHWIPYACYGILELAVKAQIL